MRRRQSQRRLVLAQRFELKRVVRKLNRWDKRAEHESLWRLLFDLVPTDLRVLVVGLLWQPDNDRFSDHAVSFASATRGRARVTK